MLKLLLSLLLLLSFAACFDKSSKIQTHNQDKDQKNSEKYKKTSKNKHVETTTTDTADTKKLDNTAESKDKVEKIDIIKQREEESLNQLLENIDPSRIKHYLSIIGNDNKEKVALDLIAHKNFLNNLFTQFNIGALNDDCLAFNANIKEEIKNKIKNEKIIENIDIKNFMDIIVDQSNILISLDKIPEYLSDDENIIKQIQHNINKQMDIKKNSEYIISEFIHYNLIFQNENVTKAIITAIAEHIKRIAQISRKDFISYMITNYSCPSTFKFFNVLKNELNDDAKNAFKHIIISKIYITYKDKKEALNNDFNKEIYNLKEYIKSNIDTLINNKSTDKQKEYIAETKKILNI